MGTVPGIGTVPTVMGTVQEFQMQVVIGSVLREQGWLLTVALEARQVQWQGTQGQAVKWIQ